MFEVSINETWEVEDVKTEEEAISEVLSGFKYSNEMRKYFKAKRQKNEVN